MLILCISPRSLSIPTYIYHQYYTSISTIHRSSRLIKSTVISLCLIDLSMSTCTTHHCPLYLCLLLLCLLSMHACTAQRLAVVDRNKPSNKFHFTNKRTDADCTVVSKVESFSSSKPVLELTKGFEITVDETEIGSTKEGSPQQYHTKVTKMKIISSRKMKASTSTAADQTTTSSDQQVSVSWRVPQKKRGIQRQPGFNLDYSPPKTHPPSHN